MSSQWIGALDNDLIGFIRFRNANDTCMFGQPVSLRRRDFSAPTSCLGFSWRAVAFTGAAGAGQTNNTLVIWLWRLSWFNGQDGGVNHVTTVQLGQYSREQANAIAGELEKAQISWWYKEPGVFSRIWEYGVRLFVDKARLDEARSIAQRVTAKPTT